MILTTAMHSVYLYDRHRHRHRHHHKDRDLDVGLERGNITGVCVPSPIADNTFISSYSYDIVYRILVCCPFDNCFVSKCVVQLISIIHHLLWKETSNPRETWWLWRMMTLNDSFWWTNCDTPWWSISCLTDENGRLDKFHRLQQIETLKSWKKVGFWWEPK